MTRLLLRFLVIFTALLSACERSKVSETEEKVFPVRGVIQQKMPGEPDKIIVDHEAIPDFMPRMIMPFHALEVSELAGLEPGMEITFDFHVVDHESWITGVKMTGKQGAITMESSSPKSAKTLQTGALFPDYTFLNENGNEVHLSEFRGKAVALTFVFSRCPVPEYCPRMMRHFADVVSRLSDRPSSYHLLTISFDHEHDTPALLKSWGASFGHREGQPWSLLSTADGTIIDRIATDTGLRFGEANGTIQHNLRTLVLNPDGTIRKIFTDESWSVDEMVAEIEVAAGSKRSSVTE